MSLAQEGEFHVRVCVISCRACLPFHGSRTFGSRSFGEVVIGAYPPLLQILGHASRFWELWAAVSSKCQRGHEASASSGAQPEAPRRSRDRDQKTRSLRFRFICVCVLKTLRFKTLRFKTLRFRGTKGKSGDPRASTQRI